jgi:hypothetical protein
MQHRKTASELPEQALRLMSRNTNALLDFDCVVSVMMPDVVNVSTALTSASYDKIHDNLRVFESNPCARETTQR